MLSKNVTKDIQSLRHKKFRDDKGLFVAEGPKIVNELIQLVPGNIQKVYAIESWMKKNETVLKGIEHQEITEIELEKISGLQSPNEVVAVLQQFKSTYPKVKNEIAIYLDTIQDPGNFGTIIRIADWFGIQNIVCSPNCADLYNSKVVQSTMASIARVNVYYDKENDWLKDQKATKMAATLNGRSIYGHSKLKEAILVIGNESKGVSKDVLELCNSEITIPKIGEAESLNAAVATGIILSHIIN